MQTTETEILSILFRIASEERIKEATRETITGKRS